MGERPQPGPGGQPDRPLKTAVEVHDHVQNLPPELLREVLDLLPHDDVFNAARVSKQFFAAAVHRLYGRIILPRAEENHELITDGSEIWDLSRTFRLRQPLADSVRKLSLTVIHQDIADNSTATSKGLGSIGPYAARTLWAHLKYLQHFKLCMMQDPSFITEPEDFEALMPNCLSEIIINFDPLTAHKMTPPIFSKLRSLIFLGDEFHWCLASSPFLEYLRLVRCSYLLPDAAPEALGNALRTLHMPISSSLLRSDLLQVDTFTPFLAHFPRLKTLDLTLADRSYDLHSPDDLVNVENEGSFGTLLHKLGVLKTTLTVLEVRVPDVHDWDPLSLEYLNYTLPTNGLRQFQALKKVNVPWNLLFGTTNMHRNGCLPPAGQILPPSVEHLKLAFPCREILPWLSDVQTLLYGVPQLSLVRLLCSEYRGDSYEWFHFLSQSDPIQDIMTANGVKLELDYEEWLQSWDDYDLEAIALVEWQKSLGPDIQQITATREKPWNYQVPPRLDLSGSQSRRLSSRSLR